MMDAGGSGIRQFLTEAVGDIIQRMSRQMPDDYSATIEKVQRGIRELRRPNFADELERQLRSNYDFGVEKGKITKSFEAHKAGILDIQSQYAVAHSELPVINQAHRDAQAAAVAFGEQRYADSLAALRRIESHLGSEEAFDAYRLEGAQPATSTAAARGAGDVGGKPKFAFEGEEDLVLLHGTNAEFTGIPNAGKDGRIYFSDSTIEGRGASSYYGDTVKKFNLSEDARVMNRDEFLTKKQVENIIAGAEDEIRRLGLPESEIARYKELITLTVDKKGRATAGELSDRLDSVDRSINPKMGEPGYDFRGGQSKSNIANAGLSREFDFIAPSGNRPHEYSVLNKDVIIDSGLRQDNLEPVGIRKGPNPDFNQFGEPYPTTPATGTTAARGAGDFGDKPLRAASEVPADNLYTTTPATIWHLSH
jgi:hypothetical protein